MNKTEWMAFASIMAEEIATYVSLDSLRDDFQSELDPDGKFEQKMRQLVLSEILAIKGPEVYSMTQETYKELLGLLHKINDQEAN